MTNLITVLSSGKGSWTYVANLIKKQEFEKIFVLCNDFSYQNFKTDNSKIRKIKIDENKIQSEIEKISKIFKEEIKDFEVAINMNSGTGDEHTILITSIIKAGLGMRFLILENEKVKEIELFKD